MVRRQIIEALDNDGWQVDWVSSEAEEEEWNPDWSRPGKQEPASTAENVDDSVASSSGQQGVANESFTFAAAIPDEASEDWSEGDKQIADVQAVQTRPSNKPAKATHADRETTYVDEAPQTLTDIALALLEEVSTSSIYNDTFPTSTELDTAFTDCNVAGVSELENVMCGAEIPSPKWLQSIDITQLLVQQNHMI